MRSISSHFRLRRWVETVNPSTGIRYSSPWPWILAIVLSLMLWAMIGWVLWWLGRWKPSRP